MHGCWHITYSSAYKALPLSEFVEMSSAVIVSSPTKLSLRVVGLHVRASECQYVCVSMSPCPYVYVYIGDAL